MAVVLAAGPALAIDDPELETTFPSIGSYVRSAWTTAITATYDRDINTASTFGILDPSNVAVSGTAALDGPRSDMGGYRWITFRPSAPLPQAAGVYRAIVHAYGLVAAGGTESEFDFTVDDTPPPAPIITDPLGGQWRDDQPVSVRGNAEPGSFATIVEGADEIARAQANSAGAFTVVLPYPPEDGVTHTIRGVVIDRATNIGPASAPLTFIHDSISLQPIITAPQESQSINSSTVTVQGSAKAGSSITVTEAASTIGTGTAAADGNWSIPIVFSAGAHTVSVTAFDGYVVDGPSGARTFRVDIVAPPAPVITTPVAGSSVGTTGVSVRGTGEPRTSVRIRDASMLRGSATVDNTGRWSTTITFSEGAHSLTAYGVDSGGNMGPSTPPLPFTVDTAAPPAPTITSPAQSQFLATSTVNLAGASEANASIRIREGAATIGVTTANGAGAWMVGIVFPDGAHSVTAVAIDAAANVSPASGLRSFTVDTSAPPTPVITNPIAASILGSTTVTIDGTADPFTTVSVAEGFIALGVASADGGGAWSLATTMSTGTHTIRAVAIDAAGNASLPTPTRTFSVMFAADVTPPAPPIISTPAASTLQRGIFTLAGSTEARSTVKVYEGATLIANSTADAAGAWETSASLATGARSIKATATDQAGNVSAFGPLRSFTVDATLPTLTIATTGTGAVFLPVQPQTLDGTASDNLGVLRVEVAYDDRISGSQVSPAATVTCVCGAPTAVWETEPSLAPGVYLARVWAVDLAGNRSYPKEVTIILL